MQLFSRQKPLVGLDIGSSSVKAVELRKMKNGYELLHVGLEPLASDTVVDGAIMDALSVSDSITKIFSESKIKNLAAFQRFICGFFVTALDGGITRSFSGG